MTWLKPEWSSACARDPQKNKLIEIGNYDDQKANFLHPEDCRQQKKNGGLKFEQTKSQLKLRMNQP